MKLSVHISETIRSVVKGLPETTTFENAEGVTLRHLAVQLGVPPILIVFAIVNGVKKNLDDTVSADAEVHFLGTMAGG